MAAAIDGGQSYRQVAAAYGVAPATVHTLVRRLRRRQAPDTGCVTQERAGDALTVESRSSASVRTLDQLLDACEVDRDLWAVERWIANKWEVGSKLPTGGVAVTPLYQIKAWLKRQAGVAEARAIVDGLLSDLATRAPVRPAIVRPTTREPHMLEFGLADHHVALLAWGEECGADYDSDISEALAHYATGEVIRRSASYDIERIVCPVGNDFFNADTEIDGKGGATTKGTAQDVDSRGPKMFRRGVRILVDMIDALRVIAPVEVPTIPGNHDRARVFALGEVLAAHYRSDPEVTILNGASPRKYIEYGVNMIGLGHGDGIKEQDLPLLMAQEAPEIWGRTIWREFHRAHLHGARAQRFTPARDVGGVIVRTIPSMVARDSWHTGKGYQHQRAAEAFVWSPTDALMGTIVVSVPEAYRGIVVAEPQNEPS